MHSDDGPPGADDQPPYELQPAEPEPPKQRPSWLIWTIVGGTAALVTMAGVVGIVAVARRGTPDGSSNGSPRPAAAVEQLRSRLPADLKSANECAETDTLSYATSTIACTWPSSHVPHTATYSLYEDSTSMLRSAMTFVRGSGGYGSSCRSAEDFHDDGGQMLWEHDGRERGTVWCYLNENDEPVILWTDTAPKILASAMARARQDAGKLLKWFLTAGRASLEPAPAPPPPSSTKASPAGPSPKVSPSRSHETSTTPKSDPPVTPPRSHPPVSDPPDVRPSESHPPDVEPPESHPPDVEPPASDPPEVEPPVTPGDSPS